MNLCHLNEFGQKKIRNSKKSTKSHKVFYRCHQVKSRSKIQCSSDCVIIKQASSTKAEVHRTVCAHDHIPMHW